MVFPAPKSYYTADYEGIHLIDRTYTRGTGKTESLTPMLDTPQSK